MTKINTDENNILFLKKPMRNPLLTPAVELKKACKASGNLSIAQELFARWPNLRESSQRLTSLLTLYWPDPRDTNDSLLVNCLKSGLLEADRVIKVGNDDLAEHRAFISKIADELVHCLELTVMIRSKGVWSPYEPNTDGYMDVIINSPIGEELTWVKEAHNAFTSPQSKLICASKIFTMNEMILAGLMEGPVESLVK
jgi:hypothetical protein